MDILGPDGERRRSARAAGLRSGFAVSHDGKTREACVVGNLSDTGALVEVEWADDVGDELLLVVDGDTYRRPARVAWRDTFRLGIEFILQNDKPENRANWILQLQVSESLPDDYFD